jgi:hypothetical protein
MMSELVRSQVMLAKKEDCTCPGLLPAACLVGDGGSKSSGFSHVDSPVTYEENTTNYHWLSKECG